MKKKITLLISIITICGFQACTSTKSIVSKNSVFWVSGYKTEASSGAGKMDVLNIYRGKDLHNPQWENFYAQIEGFEFDEGYLQRIKVKEEKLDKSQIPADGSSIKYTLVKVLDKQKDLRTELQGTWTLARLNDRPLNKMVTVPTMTLDIGKRRIFGNTGCNDFTGSIEKLSESKIEFGPVGTTKKMCINKNVEAEYTTALNSITNYQVEGTYLTFYDEKNRIVLTYIKRENKAANTRLNDIWVATRISGNPINRMTPTPRMELNLAKMQVAGNNSCNNFTGTIQQATDSELMFGNIAVDNRMCQSMEIASHFNKAISQTVSYKLEGLALILFDEQGKEVVSFLKAD